MRASALRRLGARGARRNAIARAGVAVAVVVASTGALLAARPADLAAQVSPGLTERVSVDENGDQTECPPSSFDCNSFDPAISADGRYVVFEGEPSLAAADTSSRNESGPVCDGLPFLVSCQSDIYRYDRETGAVDLVSIGVVQPPTMSIGDASALEDGSLTFPVTLSFPAPAGGVTFSAGTLNGSALSPGDFTGFSSLPFSIPAGATSTTVPVTVINDGAAEPSETMSIFLGSAVGAALVDDRATGTIIDNDVQLFVVDDEGQADEDNITDADDPSNPLPDYSSDVTEGDPGNETPLGFTVQLSATVPGAVTFTATTSNGSAEAGTDYVAFEDTFTIQPGSNAVGFAVDVIENQSCSGGGTVQLTISGISTTAPSPITAGNSPALGLIINDDTGCPALRMPQTGTKTSPPEKPAMQCLLPCGTGDDDAEEKAQPVVAVASEDHGPRFARAGAAAGAQTLPVPGTPEEADGPSFDPVISADGRFVAFSSPANNLAADQLSVDPDPSESDVFVRDMVDGATFLVSVPDSFDGQGGCATNPSMSAAGTTIAFLTLGPTSGNEFGCDVAVATVADTTDPAAPVLTPITQQVDTDFDGEPDNAVPNPGPPALSANGRFVALAGFIANVEEDVLAVLDRDTGILSRVDAAFNAGGELVGLFGIESEPALSADGRFVAFTACEGFLTCDVEETTQVQLIDRDVDGDGVFGPLAVEAEPFLNQEPFEFRLVSRIPGAAPTDLAAGGDGDSASPDISDDGRYVAFNSEAPNLVDDADGSLFNQLPDCEGPCDAILVRDQFGTGPNEVASVAQFDPPQNSPSFNPPSISGTGRFVAFDTFADNLIAAGSDTNNANDVFVREFTPTLSAAPNPLNFGTVLIGDTDSLSVTMTHSGFGPVNPASITVTGTNPGDFAAGPNTCVGVTLHDGGQCIVSVLFTPGVTGTLNATLVIAFEGSGPPATVGLTGGAGPRVATLDLNPDELVFPEQRGLTPSPARTVTVTNTGTGSTLISSVTIQGANPGDFASTANTCAATVLAPGATCAVSITFTPTAIGARQAVLRFNDDAVGGPHLVGLRGTGATPTLTISPAVIPPGGVVTVTGTNWPAVLPMLMEWADARPGTTTRFPERIRERTADGNGGLTATLVVFPNTTIGGRQLVGRVGAFTANVPLLVGRGSAQPGEFVIRR